MIALVRSWLLGVTGVAILAAMADQLMPRGTVKGVGQLVGGLVLLLAVLTPILSLDLDSLLPSASWEEGVTQMEQTLEETRKKELEAIIAEQLGAYIVDKAAAEDILCTATVICEQQGEICLPVAITIWGVRSEGERSTLRNIIAGELDIPEENIVFTEEAEP